MARDPGNSRNKAKLLQANTTFRDAVSRKDKFDFFRLDLTNRSSFSATLSGLKGNADLVLFSGNKKIAHSKRGGRKNEAINGTLNAGTYYLQVAVRGGSTRYQLKLATASISSTPTLTPTPTPTGTGQRQTFYSQEFGYEQLPPNTSGLSLLGASGVLSFVGDDPDFARAMYAAYGSAIGSAYDIEAQFTTQSRERLDYYGAPDRLFINSRGERRFVPGYINPLYGGSKPPMETIYYPIFG